MPSTPSITNRNGRIIRIIRTIASSDILALVHGRFGASRAYEGIVNQRVVAVGEEALGMRPTLSAFLARRLQPAMRTCHMLQERQADLSSKLARAANLLRTRVDVEIERASIPLLGMGVTDEKLIRSVLTIVKVNNELERVADCAVDIAEAVLSDVALPARIPPVFRVMANSVTGMLRDSNRALADGNAALAQQVLLFDDTVAMLKKELMKTAQEQVASGALPVDYAFRLLTITKSIERIADHSTNTCEQVIYLYSGLIVRHRPEGWSKPLSPSTSSPHAS